MVGKMDIARCGPCCSGTCLIADGNDTYDVCTGTWSTIPASGASTSSSDAKILYTPTFGPAPWRMVVDIAVISDALAEPEFDVRILGGVTDAGVGAFYCDGVGVYLRWVRELSGGNPVNYFECHDARYPATGTVAFSTNNGQFQLCWDGSVLSAYFAVSGQIPILIGTISNPPLGDRYGFETGTLSAHVIRVEFTAFKLYAVPDDPDYLTCTDCTDSVGSPCCEGPIPSELVFELSGWTGTILFAQTGFDGSNCQDNCGDLDGTYYLSRVAPITGTQICEWRTGGSESGTCVAFIGTSAMPYGIYVVAERLGTTLRVFLYSYDKTLKVGAWIAEFRVDVGTDRCIDWSSWINLTQYTAGPFALGNYCSGASTARIKMSAV